MKANGKIAVDTNAVIAYRAGNSEVCGIINSAEVVLVPATVVGELRYGALNSRRIMDVPLLTRDSHFENVEGLRIIPFKPVV